MKYCPVCQKPFPDDATHCDADGQVLKISAVAPLPIEPPAIKTLADLIQRQAPLSVEAAVKQVCDICDVVAQFTGKPPDYFDPRAIPLRDAAQLNNNLLMLYLQQQATATGTPNLDDIAVYLSPEIAQQQDTDATSAVYSLGVILYEMLTGQPPFTASSVAAIAIKQILETPRPPQELRGEISEPLQAVILRALKKEKTSRLQSLKQLKEELQKALQQSPATTQRDKLTAAPRPSQPQMTTGALGEVGDATPSSSDVGTMLLAGAPPEPPAAPYLAPSAPPKYALPPSAAPTIAAPQSPQMAAPPSAAPLPQVYGSYAAPAPYSQSASYPAAAPKSSKKIFIVLFALFVAAAVAIAVWLFLSKSSSSRTLTNTAPTTPANRNASPTPPVQPTTPVSKQSPVVLYALVGVVILGATATVVFILLLRRKSHPEVFTLQPPSAPQVQAPKPVPQVQPPVPSSLRCSYCQRPASPGEQYCLQCGNPLPSQSPINRPAPIPTPIPPPQPVVQNDTDAEQTQKQVRVGSPPSEERLKVCPQCQTEFPVTVKFCVHDGATLQEKRKVIPPKKEPSFYDLQTLDKRKRCPQCKEEYPEDKKFCRNDGSRLVLIPASETSVNVAEEIEPFMIAQYQCFARLGEGGMGLVYKARDLELQRLAAVKVLLPKTRNLDEAARLFRREAQLASSINHPNIVTVYSCGETNVKLLYMAMEFIEGRSLADLLKAQSSTAETLPLPKVRHITRSICEALDAAHERGIIHRDLKPQNVMICPKANRPDIVKVVDFGIARSVINQDGHETLSGSIVGTPMYMSPEQARGEFDIDERADIFSLAIIVYQMLTGKLPFVGEERNTLKVLSRRAHLQDAPPPLKTIRPDLNLPDALDTVMKRALEPDKNRRTRSAMHFIEQFEQAARMAIQ